MKEFPLVKKIRITEEIDRKLTFIAKETKGSQASVVRDLIEKEYMKIHRLELIKECVAYRKAS